MKKIFKKSGRNKQLKNVFQNVSTKAFDRSENHFRVKFLSRLSNLNNVKWPVLRWFLLVVLLIIVAVLQMVWYDKAFKADSYISGGNYHEGSVGEIKTMNPLYATSTPEKILSRLMFNGLVEADGAGGMSNILAESIVRDGDGRIWTVKMKDGIKWSDGEKLTVDDVLFTAKLIQDSHTKSPLRSSLSSVDIKKVDKKTISFELPSAYSAFVYSLDFPILPKHKLGKVEPGKLYEDNFSKNPVGSGAFMLKSMQVSGKNNVVYLNRNPNYYKTNTKLASFTLSTFETNEQLKSALKDNTIMGTGDLLDDEDIKNRAIQKRSVALNGGVFAFFNTQSENLMKVEARRAIQQGLNIKQIRKEIEGNWPLDYPILESQMEGLNYPKLIAYDKNTATNTLKEIGLSGNKKGPVLKIATPARANLIKIANNIKKQLEGLGVNSEVVEGRKEKDKTDFFSNVVQSRNYDILVYEIDMGVDADPYPYYSSSQTGRMGVNLSNLKNAMIDDLLLSARSTLDTELRKTKYDKFLSLWVEQAPAIGIYQSHMNYYHVKNARIFDEDAVLSSALDRYYDINDWGVERVKKNQTP